MERLHNTGAGQCYERSRDFYGEARADYFVGRSRELEPPFLRQLQLSAASFWQAKKESLFLETNTI